MFAFDKEKSMKLASKEFSWVSSLLCEGSCPDINNHLYLSICIYPSVFNHLHLTICV